MNEDNDLLLAQFICERCRKTIRSPKMMTIKKKHYHMVCGIRIAKNDNMLVNMK